ncbi:MAG: acyl-CoA reductase [Flavobacteriales bacterium]|nr:acyl-CoA reductase [Flavobacteriales bacterium]
MDMTEAQRSRPAGDAAPFVQLGLSLAAFAGGKPWPGHAIGLTQGEYQTFEAALNKAQARNGWFTGEQVRLAAKGLAAMLEKPALANWLKAYPALQGHGGTCTVGLILAGNIPFVGFHDLMCTLLCGHRALVKVAADDAGLTPALVELLGRFAPELSARVEFTTGRMAQVDAVIATGSTNTARYFKHYFGHLPHIIRKGRTSVAVLDGTETAEELAALAGDVFNYFGLGCRSVGKVFVPRDFDLDRLFAAFFPWQDIIRHHKYANNYDYNRAVWLMDRAPLVENGFLVLKEERSLHSPVAALFYERYDDRAEVEQRLLSEADGLQCIIGHGQVPFGAAQCPGPGDYADGVDTMEFLLGLGQGTKV